MQGQGYYATGTGSEAQDWRMQVEPVQSAGAAGTTTSNLTFRQATAGGAYAQRMSLSSAGALTTAAGITASSGNITSSGGNILATSGYVWPNQVIFGGGETNIQHATSYGVASQFQITAAPGTRSVNLIGAPPDAATAVAVRAGGYSYTTEGARIMTFHGSNAAGTEQASLDRLGVLWNAYGSGQTTGAAGTLAKTLVTTADDDSTYIVEWWAMAIDQAATPTKVATYYCRSTYDRIDGTLTRRAGVVSVDYESDATMDAVDSVSGNSVIVTATGPALAGSTVNWKVFANVKKVGSASFTGVAYPMAN
jgi:hypothetical protein